MKRRHWWRALLAVLVAGAAGVVWLGVGTYRGAPPLTDFVDARGQTVVSRGAILRGQSIFLQRALMEQGSLFGDGGGRGPDFSAEALHVVAEAMLRRATAARPGADPDAVRVRVHRELHQDGYDPAANRVVLADGHAAAFADLLQYETAVLTGPHAEGSAPPGQLVAAAEIPDLTAFFFWTAWVCAARRPGTDTSWTNGWPYDPVAGNLPPPALVFWSVAGLLALILGLGLVLYLYGRGDRAQAQPAAASQPIATAAVIAAEAPLPTQRATWGFFAAAMVLFLLQVLAGVLTVHDFVGLTTFFGVDVQAALPLAVVRSWHVQLSLLWIASCWIGASIYMLPFVPRSDGRREPPGQLALVRTLLGLLIVVALGSIAGLFLGPQGLLGEHWRLLGHQGWEFVEPGRLWQSLLLGALALWSVIVWRGVRGAVARDPWGLPGWLLYAVVCVSILFCAGFVAGPETSFVVADFWRWMVVHMWAEAFFEVFTTIVVAWFLVRMGLSTPGAASRVVFLATLLFLGSGLLGISHNFYWNAKPMGAVALGSVFSTLQVVPLVLLTVDAWRLRRLPEAALRKAGGGLQPGAFGHGEAFLFLLAVQFWNFLGAGVFGFIINLPIVNYYEHGTYLTVNHGHAALMGVYGNLSVAAVLFCCRHLLDPERWPAATLRGAFWALNVGLGLMVVLDLLPAGVLQLEAVLDQGFWFARSQAFIQGASFQTLTWLRIVGGAVFLLGGVLPLVAVVVGGFRHRRAAVLAPAVVLVPEEPAQRAVGT